MHAGTGWMLPQVWIGGLDDYGYVRNDTSVACHPPDSLGTGNMDIGFNNGTGLAAVRYHLVQRHRGAGDYTLPRWKQTSL